MMPNLVRFAHNLSRASRSCDWNVGIADFAIVANGYDG